MENNNIAYAVAEHVPTITEFLSAFFSDANEPIYLRAFKPKAASDDEHNRPASLKTTREQIAKDKTFQNRLTSLNENRGIYFVVNSGGNSDSDITRYNAFFVENDSLPIAEQHAHLDACSIQPSIRIETNKSVHAYWLLVGRCSEAEWRDMQERLIEFFDGDKANKNPSRVMRLPHFQHLTFNEADGTLIKKQVEIIKFSPERRYTLEEMQDAFPPVPENLILTREEGKLLTIDHDDPNADLKQLIMARGIRRKTGAFEMRCPAHNGNGNTSLVLMPSGAFACLKEPPCSTADIRCAFGLPEKYLSSLSSLSSPTTLEDTTNLSSPNSLLSPAVEQKKAECLAFPQLGDRALYGLAGEFVRTVYPHTEANKAALLLQLLVGVGNIFGRTAYYVADGARHYTNLYLLLVGKTSSAKGSALNHVKNLLVRIDENWARCHITHGLSSGEGLIKAVDDADSTTDKRLFVVETEFASVLQNFKRDGNKLSPILRSLWDDGSAASLTVKDSVSTTDAHVSIVGHITPEEQQKVLGTTEIANGFVNRFLLSCVRLSKLLPDGGALSEHELNSLATCFLKAVQFAQTVQEMKRDDEASELWNTVYSRLVEDREGAFGKVVARARPQVLRLSCIYALLDCSAVVKRVHLEAALALWQYCEDSARYMFGNVSSISSDAQKLFDALLKSGNEGLNRTEQHKVFSNKRTAEELDAIKAELLQAGFAHANSIDTNGRNEERLFATAEAEKIGERSEESEFSVESLSNCLALEDYRQNSKDGSAASDKFPAGLLQVQAGMGASMAAPSP